jgi:hypothetical protein
MDLTPPALRRTISDEGRALFLTALAPGEAPRTVTAPTKEKQQQMTTTTTTTVKKKKGKKSTSNLRPDTLDLLAAGLGDPKAAARSERRRREKAERAATQQHPEDEIAPARQARKHFSLTKFGKRIPGSGYPYELMGKRRPRGLRKPAA